ncbi:glycosyltransferase family 4 protein [Paucihalobacter sp.]|uniref:glycosyltransferase family 4 protein n=1 Tax=Paucihalobacter sp. TaxID=2850405 RepID=UPI002FE37B7D
MNQKVSKLLVVSYAPVFLVDDKFKAYPPYVNEMDLWFKNVNEVKIASPFWYPQRIFVKPFQSKNISRIYLPFIAFNNFGIILKSIFVLPLIAFQLFKGMLWAEHIHFRCPGNMSLFGLLVQIFFPFKPKSTKYAGNWDPSSNQPWSYRLQQAILRNRFLTRNMQVLVYGAWPKEPTHILPFISATFYEADQVPFQIRNYQNTLKMVFAASLVPGKRPLLTIQIIEALNQKGYKSFLDLFGDGPLMDELQEYVSTRGLQDQIMFHGNQDIRLIMDYYKQAHFNILPSKSEGWPKAVAEGMFFGCVPIATPVSCVAWMLGEGSRGILIAPELESAVNLIIKYLEQEDLTAKAKEAQAWSEQYTFDRLEADIEKVLKGNFK